MVVIRVAGGAQGFSLEEFDRLINLIYRAGAESSGWDKVMSAMDDHLGGAYLALYGYDLRSGMALEDVTTGFSPDQMTSYHEYYYRKNPFIAGLSTAPLMEPRTTDSYIARDVFMKTEFLNGFLAANEPVCAGAGATLVNGDGRLLVLCGHVRTRYEDDQLPLLVDSLRLLGPHVARAFGIHRRLGGQSVTMVTFEEVLDRLGNSVFVLDARGVPLYANAAAEARMAESTAITIDHGGALRFRDCGAHGAFQQGLARLLRPGDTRPPDPFRLEIAPSEVVVATLDRFREDDTSAQHGPWASQPVALLSLTDHRMDRDRVDSRLCTLYGLSRAERRLVMTLAADLSLNEAAAETGLSIHTLRSQLKSIYGKTGLNRQSQLTGLVQRLSCLV